MNDIYNSDCCAPTAHSPGSWLVKCSSHPRPGDSSTGQNLGKKFLEAFDALFELITLKDIKQKYLFKHYNVINFLSG